MNVYGGRRIQSNLSSVTTSPGYLDSQITDRCALFVVAQIVLITGARRKYSTNLPPTVAMLVLANLHGRVIAFYAVMDRGCVPLTNLQNLPVKIRKDWRYLQSCLQEYLGCKYVLVGFYISWTLTALHLTLDVMRVVDIGLEILY